LHYVRHKTQADFAFIKRFIRPIARTTQNERVYNHSKANVYELDTLRIFARKEAQLQSLLRGDVVAFFAELKSVNPHVEIQDLEVLDLKKDVDVPHLMQLGRKFLSSVPTAAFIPKQIYFDCTTLPFKRQANRCA
jgi:hypothetical protein